MEMCEQQTLPRLPARNGSACIREPICQWAQNNSNTAHTHTRIETRQYGLGGSASSELLTPSSSAFVTSPAMFHGETSARVRGGRTNRDARSPSRQENELFSQLATLRLLFVTAWEVNI